jgi:DNA repair protein RadA/Sms
MEFACQACGYKPEKWTRACFMCGRTGTVERVGSGMSKTVSGSDGFVRLGEVGASGIRRFKTGIYQLDKALGGGIAYPCVMALGGDPGIGKSTLTLQVMDALHECMVYISAEELVGFISERAARLNLRNWHSFRFREDSEPESIKESILNSGAYIAIIDSVSALHYPIEKDDRGRVRAAKPTIQEQTNIALDLTNWALKKEDYANRPGHHVTLVFICHQNKEGEMGGAKTIEYMTDVHAEFEGIRELKPRKFKLLKNRMGPTYEPAHFMMEANGLRERDMTDESDA